MCRNCTYIHAHGDFYHCKAWGLEVWNPDDAGVGCEKFRHKNIFTDLEDAREARNEIPAVCL